MNKKQLRKKLALMLSNLKKKRKYYCEVEYLESTGTQYIDTGISPNGDTGFDLYGKDLDYTAGRIRLGSRDSMTSNNFAFVSISTNKFRFTYGTGDTSQELEYIFTQKLAKRISFSSSTKICTVEFNDGTVENSTPMTSVTPPSGNRNILLFAYDSGSGLYYATSMKVGSFKISQGSTLVRDFIPVLDWDMTPCMYDRVTEQLFYNQGTGDFSYGREIHYVDYLESTGTQYIDTGILTKQSLKIKSKLDNTGATLSEFAYGVRKDTATITCATGSYNNGEQTTGYFRWGTSAYSSSCPYGVSEIEQDSSGIIVNGNFYTYGGTQTVTSQTGYTITLFAGRNSTTGVTANLNGKMYYFKLLDGTSLVRDYLPAIDENGVGFMFDRVSHTCFLNQGTGAFKYPARELEYIESTGTQYINTGVVPSGKKISADFQFQYTDMLDSNATIIGSVVRDDRDNIQFGILNSKWRVKLNNFGWVGVDCDKNIHQVILNAENGSSIDGTNITITQYTVDSSNTAQIRLFQRNGGAGSEICYAKIFYCKIYDNGVLVRDFIPCYKDGVLGLFDKVNDVFYQNAGTGTFTSGPVKEDEYE